MTGKGAVISRLTSGNRLRTCFHCAYDGYTGGLIIGNYSGSGYGLYPKKPIRGYKKINVFCAQDESIWDRTEKKEYTYGWSENYGQGDDGVALKYVRGRVLEGGPKQIVLQSENAGGCYRVTKVAYTRQGVAWWILATRITNTCQHPVHFDFFTGDDSWLGLYQSSDGDVGWTKDGLIRKEKSLGLGQFQVGGIYDLGNQHLGQQEGSFSNQANFFQIDPAVPLPDRSIFANSFAHTKEEIDPARPLDNKTLTALNMGWTDQQLEPNQGLTIAFALGLADTFEPGQTPKAPQITVEDWSVWRRYLKEGNPVQSTSRVEFASERVEMRLTQNEMQVDATYYLRNRGASTSLGIQYPIISAIDRPHPSSVLFDGQRKPVEVVDKGLGMSRFNVNVPSQGLARFNVQYTQQHTSRHAAYMVTSAKRWPGPLTRAVFVIRHPESFEKVTVSYPIQHTSHENGQVEHLIVYQPFVPKGEIEINFQ